jgi:hypothetical protein
MKTLVLILMCSVAGILLYFGVPEPVVGIAFAVMMGAACMVEKRSGG